MNTKNILICSSISFPFSARTLFFYHSFQLSVCRSMLIIFTTSYSYRMDLIHLNLPIFFRKTTSLHFSLYHSFNLFFFFYQCISLHVALRKSLYAPNVVNVHFCYLLVDCFYILVYLFCIHRLVHVFSNYCSLFWSLPFSFHRLFNHGSYHVVIRIGAIVFFL